MELVEPSEPGTFRVRFLEGSRPDVVAREIRTSDGASVVMLLDADAAEQLDVRSSYLNANGYVCINNRYVQADVVLFKNIAVPVGRTIDHIDWLKHDNRAANLRVVGMSEQNANRTSRLDKIPAAATLSIFGVTELPRYVRWEPLERKYSLHDHPYTIALKDMGIVVNPSGTKAIGVCLADKLRGILMKYQELLELAQEHLPNVVGVSNALIDLRVRLGSEYNDVVRFLKAEGVVSPHAPEADLEALNGPARFVASLLQKLPPPMGAQGGAGHHAVAFVPVPALNAAVRFKGEDYLIVDAEDQEALKYINSDKVIALTVAQYPALASRLGKKMQPTDFIWRGVMGRDIPDGFCVRSLNMRTKDARKANLFLYEGGFREWGMKPNRTHVDLDGQILDNAFASILGTDILPRHVSLGRERKALHFNVLINVPGKTNVRPYGRRSLNDDIIPDLVAHYAAQGKDYATEHAIYCKLVREYYAICEAVGVATTFSPPTNVGAGDAA